MITKQDPTQPLLLSRYRMLLCEPALQALEERWQGVFHRMILRQLRCINGCIFGETSPMQFQHRRKFYTTEEQVTALPKVASVLFAPRESPESEHFRWLPCG